MAIFFGLLWAWECRWLLFFGLGLGGFDSGPLEVREQMFCWWWDCGKAYRAGRSLGFFYFVVVSDRWDLLGLTQVGWPRAVSPGRWRRGFLVVCEEILWTGSGCG